MSVHRKPDIRERIKKRGVEFLTDKELIALILRTGTANFPVMELSANVIKALDTGSSEIITERLNGIEGMGDSKTSTILAALELGRRYFGTQRRKIHMATDVYPLVRHFEDRKQEHFICMSLNGAHEVLAIRVVSIGILNKTIVHPREVYADPIADRAAAIIICHNHPSGQIHPSDEDKNITKMLKAAGELIGITLLDHLILTPKGNYFSFAEAGLF
ncbi:DNA repair protein RadC [Brucepastera parasyntrophica]|uniref:RadC family protein n=1 Tax=Brucepastera parasyntrophica TaxID=2880008 RepID=UPI00210DAB90|nr:DNA repair protein RadC [Brucepastera parasyntrophica]ULQ60655.1 DNA repair protein RadC [Brucepastera parasyntrophica]